MRRIAPYLVLLLCLVFVGVPVVADSGRMEVSDQALGIRSDQVSVSDHHDGFLPNSPIEPGDNGNGGDRTVGDDDAPGETVKTNGHQHKPAPAGPYGWFTLQMCWFWIVVL